MMQFAATGRAADPMPSRISAWGIYDVFTVKDGEQIFLAVVSDKQWAIFCKAFGLEEMMADPRLKTNNDRVLARQVSRMDNVVDKLDEAIKLYVTKLTCGSLDEREGRRAMEIISFSINLEHVGDIIDKNLTELAAKKIKRKLQFSDEGAHELAAFHDRIVRSFRMTLAVFMSGDVNDARRLIAEKVELRSAELAAAERHLERLRAGQPETLETTSLHLDVLRDLKRIHSHICSVAYPILDAERSTQESLAGAVSHIVKEPKFDPR